VAEHVSCSLPCVATALPPCGPAGAVEAGERPAGPADQDVRRLARRRRAALSGGGDGPNWANTLALPPRLQPGPSPAHAWPPPLLGPPRKLLVRLPILSVTETCTTVKRSESASNRQESRRGPAPHSRLNYPGPRNRLGTKPGVVHHPLDRRSAHCHVRTSHESLPTTSPNFPGTLIS
jgi:hypothetical protein